MFILTFLLQLCSYLQLILFLCFGVEELPVCKVGLSFMQDHSGKCFKRKGTAAVSLKDVQSNKEATCLSCVKCNYQFCNASYKHHSQVVCAVIQVPKGRRYVSKHLMASAVICFYKRHKLFPQGLHSKLPCVEEWAAKQGLAIARLVPLLCYWTSCNWFKRKQWTLCDTHAGHQFQHSGFTVSTTDATQWHLQEHRFAMDSRPVGRHGAFLCIHSCLSTLVLALG